MVQDEYIIKKRRDGAMVKNNHCEPNKCTLIGWVDKVLEHALMKKNINNKFKVTIICPFNPNTMDDKTKPSVIYTTCRNPNLRLVTKAMACKVAGQE
jgi:hypothetical protein